MVDLVHLEVVGVVAHLDHPAEVVHRVAVVVAVRLVLAVEVVLVVGDRLVWLVVVSLILHRVFSFLL